MAIEFDLKLTEEERNQFVLNLFTFVLRGEVLRELDSMPPAQRDSEGRRAAAVRAFDYMLDYMVDGLSAQLEPHREAIVAAFAGDDGDPPGTHLQLVP